jgi:peptide/nickel transport system ATP-binding protein
VTAITVNGLCVALSKSSTEIIQDISFAVQLGEILGIVGESGCGKTTVALSVLGSARAGARITAGEILVGGTSMLGLTDRQLQLRRGRDVGYVPQDPAAALNPALRIERQLTEVLEVHARELGGTGIQVRVRDILRDVRLPSDAEFLRRYPHQLSGGQQQRVAIAMAAILRPQAIVMDEPTTGLDVTTQAHVLETVRNLCRKQGVALVYVSHDLAVVQALADRVLVVYAGRVVEVGPTQILERPVHPYTRGLVGAIPTMSQPRMLAAIPGRPPRPGSHPSGCRFSGRCAFEVAECRVKEPELLDMDGDHAARCVRASELRDVPLTASVPRSRSPADVGSEPLLAVRDLSASYGSTTVVHGVSFAVPAGGCVALVGESGSGKTTTGRCIVGLNGDWKGQVAFEGQPLPQAASRRNHEVRQRLQFIFQSPHNSLNPRRTVAESVAAPLRQFFTLNKRERYARVMSALDRVSLSGSVGERFPDELSGGERQRVAIARALVCEPRLIICDEITSALDVSVQAAIVALLADLRANQDLALLFITHNLALVRSIADRVLVMNAGRIVESGPISVVLASPEDPYTQALVASTPSLDTRVVGAGNS